VTNYAYYVDTDNAVTKCGTGYFLFGIWRFPVTQARHWTADSNLHFYSWRI